MGTPWLPPIDRQWPKVPTRRASSRAMTPAQRLYWTEKSLTRITTMRGKLARLYVKRSEAATRLRQSLSAKDAEEYAALVGLERAVKR